MTNPINYLKLQVILAENIKWILDFKGLMHLAYLNQLLRLRVSQKWGLMIRNLALQIKEADSIYKY
ncbi:hypothetical protein J2S25_004108 [Mesobacillus stamsii]|uniref:Tn3 transposase DDE domain-containing protein n=1 Tax=Mesobacillus stamsii TaxID=225347 RepID=A0ABU0G1M2_9BACI|nr:hypothetical protein [Mesobacillus stamsii]